MNELTTRPYGANFVLDFQIDDKLEAALAHQVPIVSFFWGNAGSYVPRLKAAGALAIQVVGSVAEAAHVAEAGFDLIVAQGHEAGGHICGQLGLIALLPQVVDAVAALPVLAGGGIADQRGVSAALALGAAGVWVGTRMVAANEANIHPVYRERVLASSGDDSVYSTVFDIGWPDAPAWRFTPAKLLVWFGQASPLRQLSMN
jgi:NAD(P)H-dependent flavin oxidoreductase YrpB (nitropropane dioxygenase family)